MFLRLILSISLIIIVGLLYIGSNKPNSTKTNLTTPNSTNMDNKWIISTHYENNFPVIMKLIKEVPNENTMKRLPYLTIISWKYNGGNCNGMPEQEVNNKMITFEDAIESAMENTNTFTSVYTRTGSNLKEFVYYCTKQNEFMDSLNQSLQYHEAYPIEINFYEDKEWIDFKKILNDFNK